MKKYIVVILIICCVLAIILVAKIFILTQDEKEIIKYLDKVNSIFDKARQTRNATPTSEWGMDDANEALRISNNSIKEIMALKMPKECTVFNKSCMDYLNNLIEYDKLRIETKNPSQFESASHNLILAQSRNEEQKFKENIRILNAIGSIKVFIYRFMHRRF